MSRASYVHRGGEEPLLGATIPEQVRAVARRFPGHEAVVSLHQGKRLRYAELEREVDRLARALLALGYARGERIGIWSTNNLEWLTLQLASARIGAVLVTVNPAYRAAELAHALRRSGVRGLFAIPGFRSSDYVATLIELIPALATERPECLPAEAFPDLREVVIYDPTDAPKTMRPAPGFRVWQEVLARAEEVTPEQLEAAGKHLDRDDPINIQYTSGTTGLPKAVTLTHHNILNNAWFAARALALDEHDRLCVPVPFYHCFGMVLANLACLSVGACLVLPGEHFDPEAVLHAVESERCTALHGVPTMFVAELELLDGEAPDLSSLRTGIMAGAPCPPALMRRVMQDLHCPEILIGYGETEASPLTHLTAADDTLERRTETVGRNLPHQEVKIVDVDDGRTLPIGETGEVCFRGYHVMLGYYGDEQATREAIDANGWLHSGDLGAIDEHGYLRITGRRKEMIIRGGENIYPREVEDVLYTHPKVAAVAVFGVPDDYYGERVAAWVQLHPGAQADAEELQSYCAERLAHFKVPRCIRFVDEFPMTVTGKLQKFRMRELEQATAPANAARR